MAVKFPLRMSSEGASGPASGARRSLVNRLLESRWAERLSYEEYRQKVRHVYDGPRGAILAVCSMLSGHLAFGERLIRERRFDLRGVRHILDVGSGAGQIVQHLLKYADPEARITCIDLSWEMLRRARQRLRSDRPRYVVADMCRLPFEDAQFDCVTCGYVLEHVPDPRMGLAELARVMTPGAKMLLLTTEDNFSGAWTSRVWCCRTYNRQELRQICESLGLYWRQELWFSKMHQWFRAGGICVEIVKGLPSEEGSGTVPPNTP
jgi:ubiquinone/menaquinone biosynthesis C-methylase UbiE